MIEIVVDIDSSHQLLGFLEVRNGWSFDQFWHKGFFVRIIWSWMLNQPSKNIQFIGSTTTTSLVEEGLVRDEQTNDVFLPLTSTVVLKRKQAMLYVPLDFKKSLTAVALVDSGSFVSATAQNDLETIREKAPINVLKINDPPNFQIQVANGQLEKPLATATPNFEIGDIFFVEHFVVLKKITGPKIGLLFMRNNSVVIDTTHGLIHFPHLTMQVKRASSEATTKPQPVITSSLMMPWGYHRWQQKQSQPLLTIRRNGTQQELWHRCKSLRKQQVCWFPTQCPQYMTKEEQSE